MLVPYIRTHGGGVRTVLGAGLPRLSALPGVRLVYAELCRSQADMDEMERAGVQVDRDVGLPGSGVLSRRAGWLRAASLAARVPQLARMARRLSTRLGACDVCYVHGHRELLLALAARALAGRGRSPAIVWHWHGPPLSVNAGARGSRAGRWVARLASRGCARLIAVSRFCARQMADMGVAPHRIATVLNAAALRGSGPGAPDSGPLPRPPGAFVSLVACSSIRRHKGIHLAVEAMRDLPANHVLWVTGDRGDPGASAYVAELERSAQRLGVGGRLVFLGVRRDIHRVMAEADAVVVPSIWEEPFGLVAAEAQLAGVPVVVSRRGSLPEIAGDGELGLVFDPADPRSLAGATSTLAADAGRRARLTAAARQQAEARYGYDRWSREVAAVLAEAAAPVRARSAAPAAPRRAELSG